MLASGQTARFFAGKFVFWLVLFSKEFVCGQLSTTMVLLNLSRHIQSKVYLLKPQCNRVEIIFTFWFVSFKQAMVTNYWWKLLEVKAVRFGVKISRKELNTLTHSKPFLQSRGFNKVWNLGQTSAWFCLAKSGTRQVHVTTLTNNPCSSFA